ncbi:hypothetical protein PanWU01x14_062790 [Parasponia andersonii]|uniref:Uncharacterized protein n=1 Tax=Parasponia andersonii TaxID=3476 RepID=A0A2P5DHR0_PARAD|nr:hypothetical protein PanWU01x14_062790 [Parasponia andersonii]
MTSVCISNCVNDARDPRVPVRATYLNLYKWPESDAEFVRSVSSRGCRPGTHVRYGHPRVVDSISCRQIYLRSYTFSRKETVPERTQKCFGRVKQKMADFDHGDEGKQKSKTGKKKKCLFLGKVRELSYAALFGIFQRCLYCAATVDVADQ